MQYIYFFLSVFFVFACKDVKKDTTAPKIQKHKHYSLMNVENADATLILFPGGGHTSKQSLEEFNILAEAEAAKTSVLYMNFNRHIWIEKEDCEELEKILEKAFEKHKLNRQKIGIGGMSIGGNVALSLSDYLVDKNSAMKPSHVFIIDSPIDLNGLYVSAKVDIENPDFTEERKGEPKFIMSYFEENFGKESLLENIVKVSPFVLETNNSSVQNLQNTKVRFYTEPDPAWWQENRQTAHENTNAFYIIELSKQLKKEGWTNLELIETKDKGYRANGDRHPHSWSIVNKKDLLTWLHK